MTPRTKFPTVPTRLINALRGHLAEFGLIAAQGRTGINALEDIISDEAIELPDEVRNIARLYLEQIKVLTQKVDELHFNYARQPRSMTQCAGFAPCQALVR